MNETRTYYAIGYRDALAVLCAEARMNGPTEAVQKAAEKLLEMDPEHCHAKVVLERIDVNQREQRRKIWRKKRKTRTEGKTTCSSCGNSGIPRIDNGVPAGTHCDTCWQKLVSDARKRSW
jgi:hypothetical protein